VAKTKNKICSIKDCNKAVLAKGLCPRHYMRLRNGVMNMEGDLIRPLYFVRHTHCKICGKLITSGGSKNRGFCSTHNSQFYRKLIDEYGKPLKRLYSRKK